VLKVPLSASKRVDFAMGSRTAKTMLMRLLLALLHVVAFWHVSTTAKVHWKEAPVLAQKEKRFLLMEGHAKIKMSAKNGDSATSCVQIHLVVMNVLVSMVIQRV